MTTVKLNSHGHDIFWDPQQRATKQAKSFSFLTFDHPSDLHSLLSLYFWYFWHIEHNPPCWVLSPFYPLYTDWTLCSPVTFLSVKIFQRLCYWRTSISTTWVRRQQQLTSPWINCCLIHIIVSSRLHWEIQSLFWVQRTRCRWTYSSTSLGTASPAAKGVLSTCMECELIAIYFIYSRFFNLSWRSVRKQTLNTPSTYQSLCSACRAVSDDIWLLQHRIPFLYHDQNKQDKPVHTIWLIKNYRMAKNLHQDL